MIVLIADVLKTVGYIFDLVSHMKVAQIEFFV